MVVQERPITSLTTAVPLTEWRCRACRRLLMKLRLSPGVYVECVCKCNALNVLAIDAGPATR